MICNAIWLPNRNLISCQLSEERGPNIAGGESYRNAWKTEEIVWKPGIPRAVGPTDKNWLAYMAQNNNTRIVGLRIFWWEKRQILYKNRWIHSSVWHTYSRQYMAVLFQPPMELHSSAIHYPLFRSVSDLNASLTMETGKLDQTIARRITMLQQNSLCHACMLTS